MRASRADDLGSLAVDGKTTIALTAVLDTRDGIACVVACLCALFNGVVRPVVSGVSKSTRASVIRIAALESHVAGIYGKYDRGVSDERGVRKWVISCLLAGVSKIIGSGTISVEVVCEQTGDTSRGGHHGTCIVTNVHEINSITMTGRGGWFRASWRKPVDKSKETLVTVGTTSQRRTAGRIITGIFETAGVRLVLGIIVGLNFGGRGRHQVIVVLCW